MHTRTHIQTHAVVSTRVVAAWGGSERLAFIAFRARLAQCAARVMHQMLPKHVGIIAYGYAATEQLQQTASGVPKAEGSSVLLPPLNVQGMFLCVSDFVSLAFHSFKPIMFFVVSVNHSVIKKGDGCDTLPAVNKPHKSQHSSLSAPHRQPNRPTDPPHQSLRTRKSLATAGAAAPRCQT